MLTPGHIATSYLIAASAQRIGISLQPQDVLLVVIAGNIVDLDFVYGLLVDKEGEMHHDFPTHTPLVSALIWVCCAVILKTSLGLTLIILMAMLVHLALDDLGYWLYKINISKLPVNSQINWFYPFSRKINSIPPVKSNIKVLANYIFGAWPISLLELGMVVLAAVVYLQ